MQAAIVDLINKINDIADQVDNLEEKIADKNSNINEAIAETQQILALLDFLDPNSPEDAKIIEDLTKQIDQTLKTFEDNNSSLQRDLDTLQMELDFRKFFSEDLINLLYELNPQQA